MRGGKDIERERVREGDKDIDRQSRHAYTYSINVEI